MSGSVTEAAPVVEESDEDTGAGVSSAAASSRGLGRRRCGSGSATASGEEVAGDEQEGLPDSRSASAPPRLDQAVPSTPASGSTAVPLAGAPPTPTNSAPASAPQTPVWHAEPASIDEPLLLLDEEETQRARNGGITDQLHAELAEVRASLKADRAALEAMATKAEALEHECAGLRVEQTRLEQEKGVLRLQLEDHHGIMAADWAQTIAFQERLRHEEEQSSKLSDEVAELREGLVARTEEAIQLRQDASKWRMLSGRSSPSSLKCEELYDILEVMGSALTRLHTEASSRSRGTRQQLHSELEQQLCVVCRDAKKTVLFIPCNHVCVCEGCRGRLRPYRCPMCQERIQSHIGRVHF